jgi:hypothetical protein
VTAAVAGVCATGVGCVILAATVAGAASGAASYGTGVALGDDEFSAKGLATATLTGAAVGAVTGGLGAGASAVKTAVTEGAEGAAESAGASAVTDTAADEGAENGATKTAAQEGPRGKGTPGPDDPASVTDGGRSTGGQAVAGHGWHARSNGTTVVPPGTYLHFYVEHGEKLADSVGLQIERGARNIKPVETFGPGSRIPNYTIAPPRGLNIMSGSTTVTQSRLLSEMFEDGTISGVSHVAVCREVIPGELLPRSEPVQLWRASVRK